jgi:hypothetical protein
MSGFLIILNLVPSVGGFGRDGHASSPITSRRRPSGQQSSIGLLAGDIQSALSPNDSPIDTRSTVPIRWFAKAVFRPYQNTTVLQKNPE